MRIRTKLRQVPVRVATGAFILNTGFTKLDADDETAKSLHGMASNVYPFLSDLEPSQFTKALAVTEIGLGAALLVPMISSRLAGVGLGAFAGGLLGLYLKTPGLRREGSLRPTQAGTAIAKDIWMLGIAMSLVLDS